MTCQKQQTFLTFCASYNGFYKNIRCVQMNELTSLFELIFGTDLIWRKMAKIGKLNPR